MGPGVAMQKWMMFFAWAKYCSRDPETQGKAARTCGLLNGPNFIFPFRSACGPHCPFFLMMSWANPFTLWSFSRLSEMFSGLKISFILNQIPHHLPNSNLSCIWCKLEKLEESGAGHTGHFAFCYLFCSLLHLAALGFSKNTRRTCDERNRACPPVCCCLVGIWMYPLCRPTVAV